MRRWLTAVGVGALLWASGPGCADPGDPAPSDAAAGDVPADSSMVPADSTPGGPADTADDGAPPIPTLPGEGAPRRYRLRLVNLLERPALVFASAGAGRVALDTVPGSDSTLVDIRLRADRVTLEARDSSGRVVKTEDVGLDGSMVNRWEIRRGDAGPVAARRAPRPLVRPETGEYPRSR